MSKRIGVFVTFWLLLLCGCPKAHAQTPVSVGPQPKMQFLDQSGTPLSGGIVCTYAAGTSNAQATYTDSTGVTPNANPVVLDSAGRANIWFSSLAYKIVLAGGGTCGSPSNLQWTVDGFSVGMFANANISFTGNNTSSGTWTFNGAVTLGDGGALSGAFTGSPTFSGNVTFSGNPNYTGTPVFSNGATFSDGLIVDSIFGSNTTGGTFGISGANGNTGHAGEGLFFQAGNSAPGSTGADSSLIGGAGGAGAMGGRGVLLGGAAGSGNNGGGNALVEGGTGSGNASGGEVEIQGGDGGGTGSGGTAVVQGGTPGTGAHAGDVDVNPGNGSTAALTGTLFIKNGRIIYSDYGVHYTPSCTVTGGGASPVCSLDSLSKDSDGYISFITGGSGIAAAGTVVLTFTQSMGGSGATCMWNLSNVGTGQWDARATVFVQTQGTSTATATWDNNAVNLTSADSYAIAYHCIGRQ